jgi:hypothetical protein
MSSYFIKGGLILSSICCIPSLLGFGVTGVVAGSTAAVIQSGIGNVASGSLFAIIQSCAMKGVFANLTTLGLGSTSIGITGWLKGKFTKTQ